MNVLVIDMTHGGVLIASEFSKKGDYNVFALDIYKTLTPDKKAQLIDQGIKLVEEDFLDNLKEEYLITAPIHCNKSFDSYLTNHEAVNLLLKDKINVPVIEVTGVKGKTSVAWMLKEIFMDLKPLVLSSLGVEVFDNHEERVLKRNISITPASILESWNMAQDYNIGICIFETSLGGTGLADVGLLTNIAENYPIASGNKTACEAKAQIFKSNIVVCDFDSHSKYYSQIKADVNTFGINKEATVSASKTNYGLDKTTFKVNVKCLKTKNGDILNTSFAIETFAPAKHHVLNSLCAICGSLSINTPINKIIEGLKRFKGVEGRTSIKNHNNSKIIEEINPGINVTAIRKSVQMIENEENSALIFGGKYGVTCEEIDEKTTAEFLNTIPEKIELILVDELGENIKSLMKRKYKYTDFNNAISEAVKMNSKMVLLIYRSNFSDISKR